MGTSLAGWIRVLRRDETSEQGAQDIKTAVNFGETDTVRC